MLVYFPENKHHSEGADRQLECTNWLVPLLACNKIIFCDKSKSLLKILHTTGVDYIILDIPIIFLSIFERSKPSLDICLFIMIGQR